MINRNFAARIGNQIYYIFFELIALSIVCGTFILVANYHAKYIPDADVFWEKRYSYLAAIKGNLFAWNSFITIIELMLLFALCYILIKVSDESNHPKSCIFLYPLRSYLNLVIFSFTAATWINAVVVKGSYFVPSSLLFSVLLFLMLPIILVIIFEPYEKSRIRFTMIELAVIFGIMAVGWLLPRVIEGVSSSRTIGDYVVSVAMVYIVAYYTVLLLAMSDISSSNETLSQLRRFIIKLRDMIIIYLIWLLLLLYVMMLIWWALLGSFSLPLLYGGICVLINIIQGTSTDIGKEFYNAVTPLTNAICIFNYIDNIFPILFSPFRLFGIYINGMLSELAKGSPWGICKTISFLASIHYINYIYLQYTEPQSQKSTNNSDSAGHNDHKT